MTTSYLLIPGNPPAVRFYELWAREIESGHPGSRALVSPYPDLAHSSESPEAMRKMVGFHLERLKELHLSSGAPVTIIGHSLGGYVALGLVERAPDLVREAVLVHPFLRVPSLRGRAILRLASALHGRTLLQKAIVRSRKALELLSTELPHVTDQEIFRSFQIAFHENATIARDRAPVRIDPAISGKVRALYTARDSWCSPEVVADLRRQVAVHECTEPHGFVTREGHRRSLFRRILETSGR